MNHSDDIILIPEGEYRFAYECHETMYYLGGHPKVTVWLEIIDHSLHFGKLLPRYYNAKSLIGKPAVGGAFTVGMKSDCAREFAFLTNQMIDPANVTLEEFTSLEIVGEVKTVTKARNRKDLHSLMQYSKVDALIRASSG